jgi:IS605 OrfB family transposase
MTGWIYSIKGHSNDQDDTLPVFTYQTRVQTDGAADAALQAYARLYGKIERKLFALLAKNASLKAQGRGAEVESITAIKSRFIVEYGITARHFNAIRMTLEGKIDSIKVRQDALIGEADDRVKRAVKTIAKLAKELQALRHPKATAMGKQISLKTRMSVDERREKIKKTAFSLHQKKRHLSRLQAALARLRTDKAEGRVGLCFGSRKRFRAQFNDPQRGSDDFQHAWLADWKNSRSEQFFLVGSKDETAGCQSCVATVQADQGLSLRVRLPDAFGKHIVLVDVFFAYGQKAVLESLDAGRALSYRFIHDDRGWRVFVSTEHNAVKLVTRTQAGAIGIDLNVNHLALAEVDRFGNLIDTAKLDCHVHGSTTDQARALIGDLAKAVAARCAAAGKPLVIEQLDFQARKKVLSDMDPRQARMLSGFFYASVGSALRSACFRAGVEVIEVNPAYTSTIGAVNYAQSRGISVHQGAAMAIARRGLGFSEHLTSRIGLVPARKGGHVTFDLPARNRSKHGWSFWSGVRKNLNVALAAHFRSGAAKAQPAPLLSATQFVLTRKGLAQSSRSTRRLPENPRHARRTDCSGVA